MSTRAGIVLLVVELRRGTRRMHAGAVSLCEGGSAQYLIMMSNANL